jgi:hypothetical protein
MASSRFLISSQTLASSAASVTFSSIPATYTDLVLRISGRTTGAAVLDNLGIQFNGSATAVYSDTTLRGAGAGGADSVRDSNYSAVLFYNSLTENGATSNTFGNAEVYIPSYTVSQNKPVSGFGVGETNATTAYMSAGAFLWRNTAAITSLVITSDNAQSFVSGSSFYLYGLKNS